MQRAARMSPDSVVPDAREARDPWTLGGLVLLGLLTLLAVLLYRSAPQSAAEAGAESWLAARPNAVAPHLARARERLEYAAAQAAAGNDSAAVAADSVAAESAWRARELTTDAAQRAEATTLWADAMLASAEILRRGGTGAGLRPDDNDLLRRALARVERVLAVTGAHRARAEALRDQLTRQLRTGPLEWLPVPR